MEKHLICFKIYLLYLIYPYFIFHPNQKYFNILKNILHLKKLTISLSIIFHKSIITQKKSLTIIISNIKSDQVINKVNSIRLLSMMILIIIII